MVGCSTLSALSNLRYGCFDLEIIGQEPKNGHAFWLSTVPTWIRSCGICGGQIGTGAGFLLLLWFPLPSFPLIAPH
jgi:hypothetical protein